MAARFIKNDFSKGVVSPAIQANQSSPKYVQGVKDLKNMIVLPNGGVANRPGTQYINIQKSQSDNSITRPFIYGENNYILEFGDQYVRFYKDGAQITSGGTPYELATPFKLVNDLYKLNFAQTGDDLYIFHPDYITQILTRNADADWSIADYDYVSGPFMPLNDAASETITPSGTTGNITLTAVSAIFSNVTGAKHSTGKTLWQLNEVIPAQHLNVSIAAASTASTNIKSGGSWRIITHGTWTGTLAIEISSDGGSTWKAIRYLSSAGSGSNYDTFGSEDGGFYYIRVASTSDAWTGTAVIDLCSDSFLWSGYVKITQVPAGGGGSSQLYDTCDATVIDELASTSATNDWAEGSWSAVRGYPSTGTFYQDRLCSAGTVSEPQTVWMTESGFYNSYKRNSPLLDSDGITVNLPSRMVNKIYHLVGMDDLIVFTQLGEWLVTSADGIMTPTTVVIKSQSNNGCNQVKPVIIGNRAIYIDKTGAVIRDIGYDYNVRGYIGNDLSSDAIQLFKGYSIIDMDYQSSPYPIVWCVRNDGVILTMTYTDNGQSWGWARQETPEGLFKSLAIIPGDNGDEIWFLVYRKGWIGLDSSGVPYYIERLQFFTDDEMYKQKFLDSYAEYSNSSLVSLLDQDQPIISYSGDYYLQTESVSGIGSNSKIRLFGLYNDLNSSGNISNYYTVITQVDNKKFRIKDIQGDEIDLTQAFNDIIIDGIKFKDDAKIGEIVNVSGLNAANRFRRWITPSVSLSILTTVDVLGDGNFIPLNSIDGDDNITLNDGFYACEWIYGIHYNCDIELLPPVFNLNDGPMQGVKHSIVKAMVGLINSCGGKIGYDDENLSPIFEEGQDNHFGKDYDGYPEYYSSTGNGESSIGSNMQKTINLLLRQDEPYPFEVANIIMYIDLGGD